MLTSTFFDVPPGITVGKLVAVPEKQPLFCSPASTARYACMTVLNRSAVLFSVRIAPPTHLPDPISNLACRTSAKNTKITLTEHHLMLTRYSLHGSNSFHSMMHWCEFWPEKPTKWGARSEDAKITGAPCGEITRNAENR